MKSAPLALHAGHGGWKLIFSLRSPALIPHRASAPSETWPGYYHSSRDAGLDYGLDEELRAQRLGLLQTLVNEFFQHRGFF